MVDQQRSLSGYKSKIHEQGEFENPNEGKPLLTEFDEYIFRLLSFPKVKTFSQVKEKKDGTRITVNVDKAICQFEEEKTHNIVSAFFRVDSLNFDEDESFESAVIRFFRKIGTPLPQNMEPDWDKYFIVGMRFRGRVAIGKDAQKKPNGNYYLDVPTCRPILPTDRHPEAPAPTTPDIESIRLLVKGAASYDDGMIALVDAKQSNETIKVYMAAVKDGKISFPV